MQLQQRPRLPLPPWAGRWRQAGVLWERLIVSILDEIGFKSTTHERNLYHDGEIDGDLPTS